MKTAHHTMSLDRARVWTTLSWAPGKYGFPLFSAKLVAEKNRRGRQRQPSLGLRMGLLAKSDFNPVASRDVLYFQSMCTCTWLWAAFSL